MEKKIIIAQSAIILILLILLFKDYGLPRANVVQSNVLPKSTTSTRLLAAGVYSGTLAPQSHLIFNFKPLQEQMKKYLVDRNLNVSVYILNQRDGSSTGINEEAPFEPASLNKLPIAILILRKIEEGGLRFDTVLPIMPEDRDSRSGTLYKEDVSELTVHALLDRMITESDNTAFRVLSREVTLKELEALSTYLDFYRDDIGYTYDSLSNNTYFISPESTTHLFLSLYLSTILQPQDDEYLLSLLTNTTFDIHGVARLPKDIIIAHKYGSYFVDNKKYFHNCGIMYLAETRIFYCIMTQNLDKPEAEQTIGDLVHMTYTYVEDTRAELTTRKL
ncbi:class A beta-lactamase-related serine hydrolase [Candidatus Pacearchaeota archaeon]|nr:class A beta-lactamase-related serine hydrolase [Candidatus Pacearchaeota archaeon]